MKRILIFLTILFFISCTSQKENISGKNWGQLPKEKKLSKFVNVDCTLQGNIPNMPGSLDGKFVLAGRDSLSLRIFAIFGIEAARIFMSENSFTALSMLESKAYQGVPRSENLKEATGLNLSFKDLVSIIRSEVPGDRTKYKFDKALEGDRGLFRKKGEDFVEFVTVNGEGNMSLYQQVNADGQILLKVQFADYEIFEENIFAQQINIEFPINDIQLNVKADKIVLSEPKKLSIDIPNGFETTTLE